MYRKIQIYFRRPIAGTLTLFFILVCLFFYKVFIGQIYSPTNLYYAMPPWNSLYNSVVSSGALISDPIDSYLPGMKIFKDSIMEGNLSFWTSSHSLGVSTVVENIGFLFSPNTLVYLIFPLEYASNIDLMLRVYISLVGMFLFLYKLNINVTAARLGAIIFAFSLPMIVWLNWPHIWVSCLAPWLFLSVQNIYESNRKWIPVSAFIIACMIYGNMPAYAAYYLYAAGAYFVYLVLKQAFVNKSFRFVISKFLEFTTAVALGIGMAFAYILNFLNYMNGIGFIEQREGSFQPFSSLKYLIALFDPNYFRNLGIPTIHFNEYSSYFGVATLFIFFFAFIYSYKKQYRKHLFWAISAIVIGLVIYGSPLTKLFSYLPGIGTSLAIRLVGVMVFLVAVTSAYIFSYLIEDFNEKLTYVGIIVSFTFVGILLATGMKFVDVLQVNSTLVISSGILLIAVFLLTLSAMRPQSRGKYIIILAIVVTGDIFRAGMFYNPAVEAKALSLTPETEVTTFLSKNLNNQRFIALGTWTIFPNSSTLYNINDLRGHSFLLRENRIKNFNMSIDSGSYVSETRTGFNKITNFNLLDAAAVKYIVSENEIGEEQFLELSEVNKYVPIGEILADITIEQSFISPKENLSSISIQFATYNRSFQQGVLQFELIGEEGKVIRSQEIKLSDLVDNKYYSVSFEPIKESQNKYYKFRISTNDTKSGNAPTIWSTTTKVYKDGVYYNNGAEQDSTLMFKLGYLPEGLSKVAYLNGEYVYENLKALPRAYLIDQVKVEQNPDEILLHMSAGGAYQAAYVEEPISSHTLSNNHSEITEVENFTDQGNILTMEVNTEKTKFLVLTDNYLEGWSAYIDGEETKVYRTNYLFKGIEVPEGTHVITFKYTPKYIKSSLIISGIFYIITLALFIFFIKKVKVSFKDRRINLKKRI